MIDIHDAHHAATTWREFFIHIATIVLGLLIAIGLEQAVEAVHHRHQRAELTEQMRVEAQNNLPLIRASIVRLKAQAGYMHSLEKALLAGKQAGTDVEVNGVPPAGGSSLYVSPSRATWGSAQAAGLTALLPADQAKVYARLDFNTAGEIVADHEMHETLQMLISECMRAHYDHASPAVSRITVAHRDDLLFQVGQVSGILNSLIGYLSLIEGGDEAILAGVRSLDEMYPYQLAALRRSNVSSPLSNFYGRSLRLDRNLLNQTDATGETGASDPDLHGARP